MIRVKEKIVLKPGRYDPVQRGHIEPDKWLLNDLRMDKIIVGIGSCFELGYPRHPILAFQREKMYARSWMYEGLDIGKLEFVNLEDFHNFKFWWDHIIRFAKKRGVTHFATGNYEDIIGVLLEKKLEIPFEIIDIEKELPEKYRFPYHSTDLRNAIYRGDNDLFLKIAAPGTIAMLDVIGGRQAIIDAIDGRGTKFVPGRQTVDMIVLTQTKGGRPYVLTGYRNQNKKDFPGHLAIPGGAINEYESPLDAVLREPKEETGLDLKFIYKYLEPSIISVRAKRREVLAELLFGGLFSSIDPALAGTQGGSSQLFISKFDANPRDFDGMLESKSDLEKVAFRPLDEVLKKEMAFQHGKMIENALGTLRRR